MRWKYFDCFLKCCCKKLAAPTPGGGSEDEFKSKFWGLRNPEWLVLLIHITALFFAILFIGMSVPDGYSGKFVYNIGILTYGIVRLICAIEFIIALCKASATVAYIAMAVTVKLLVLFK